MTVIALICAGWIILSVALAYLLGRAIRIADDKEGNQ